MMDELKPLHAGRGVVLTDNGDSVRIDVDQNASDHKVATGPSDENPGYLAGKILAGSNVSVTNLGSALEISATAQEGDHKVSVDGTDTAGYLENKIMSGTNVSFSKAFGILIVSADEQEGDHKVSVDGTDTADYLEDKIDAGSNVSITKSLGKLVISSTDTGMLNPMTTAGDIITGGAGGAAGRLGIGTNGQVLTVDSGSPSWQTIPTQTGDHKVSVDGTDAAGYLEDKIDAGSNVSISKSSGKLIISSTDTGMMNPMTTTGDIIVGGASGSPDRLAIGTAGQVLTVNSGEPTWQTIPTQEGDHKVLATNFDTGPAGYLDSKLSFSSPLIATGTDYLSVSIDYGSDGQILATEGTTVKWVDRPEKVCWNINPNQTSSALTRVIDRTYFSQFFGTPGITNPTDIYVRMHEAHTSDQYYVYVFNNSNEMTHYSAFTSPTNTSVFKIPLTKLAATFTPEYYYIAIALHVNAGGQNTRFRSSTFGSSTWYYDGVFSSGDPKPGNSSLTTTTTAPCFALVGR